MIIQNEKLKIELDEDIEVLRKQIIRIRKVKECYFKFVNIYNVSRKNTGDGKTIGRTNKIKTNTF